MGISIEYVGPAHLLDNLVYTNDFTPVIKLIFNILKILLRVKVNMAIISELSTV